MAPTPKPSEAGSLFPRPGLETRQPPGQAPGTFTADGCRNRRRTLARTGSIRAKKRPAPVKKIVERLALPARPRQGVPPTGCLCKALRAADYRPKGFARLARWFAAGRPGPETRRIETWISRPTNSPAPGASRPEVFVETPSPARRAIFKKQLCYNSSRRRLLPARFWGRR